MNSINKLIELFSKFPGIGPRQAKRFVYFLLTRNSTYLEELSRLLLNLKKEVSTCESCMRFFSNPQLSSGVTKSHICDICRNPNRQSEMLMMVERDADFENIEKSKVYEGKYFILGGKVPILEKHPEQRVRAQELVNIVSERAKNSALKEIILALPINPDGENTEQYVKKLLSPLAEKYDIKISMLGRGLSTGIELEYPDSETLKNAFQNRT
jgi:recombination protein RecR